MTTGLTLVVALPFEVPAVTRRREGVEVVVAGVGGHGFVASRGEGPVIIAGTCGLLVAGGRRATLVVPEVLVAEANPARLEPDARLRDELVNAALTAGCTARTGTLLEASSVVDEPERRRRLAERHAAVAVDLESHRLASAAAAAGRPWAVLRWVADTPERPLTVLAALLGSVPSGQPAARALFTGLCHRPMLLLPLAGLAVSATLGRHRAGRVLCRWLRSRAVSRESVP